MKKLLTSQELVFKFEELSNLGIKKESIAKGIGISYIYFLQLSKGDKLFTGNSLLKANDYLNKAEIRALLKSNENFLKSKEL